MTVSRPLLIALLLALALLAASMAMRAIGTGGEAEMAPAPPPPAAATEPAPSARAERRATAAGDRRTDGARTAASGRARASSRRHPAGKARNVAPLPAVRAIASGHTVVLVFHQDRSADDVAVHEAADALRGTRAKVFVEPLSRLGRYRRLVGNLEIAQAPATVVVGRRLEATLLEGYVDAGSLRQFVADARR